MGRQEGKDKNSTLQARESQKGMNQKAKRFLKTFKWKRILL